MSSEKPEQRLRFFETSPAQRHIEDRDRYLYQPPERHWRIGVIGAGTMGQEHIRVTHLIGRARVQALYDPHRPSVLSALDLFANEDQPTVYESLPAIVADPHIDAFLICTPNHTHLKILADVMAAGKPILLEKPMATTLADARRILELAEDFPTWIQLGLQYRYKATYREAWHEVTERRSLGALHTLSISEYRPPFLDKVGQWNKFSANTGGTLVEKCCHYFDLLNRFADSTPTRVFATGGQAVNFTTFQYEDQMADMDDHAFVLIDYDNGVRAQFTLNMFAPEFHETLIASGNAGRLVTSERFDPQRPETHNSQITVETIEPNARRESHLSYGATIEQSGHAGATWHEQLAFLDRLDGADNHAATLIEGLWSIIVAVAAQESMASGNPVQIDELIADHGLAPFLAK